MFLYNRLLIICCAFFWQPLFSLTVGSNSTPSRQATIVTFPQADTDNTMLGFTSFEGGFTLASSRTTVTYDAFFPVSGNVRLNNGQLWLKKDLIFDKALRFVNGGSIWGGNYSVEFGKLITDLSMSSSLMFDRTTVTLDTDMTLTAQFMFRNPCKINGRGKRLLMQDAGGIVVRPGTNLILEGLELQGLKSNNLRCMTDNGSITLRNCTLTLERDYTFSRGTILFDEDNIITGTNKIIYSAGFSSTIASLSTLFLDRGITFSYAPRNTARTLLYMPDATSVLYCNGCTLHSTRTGLQLMTGTVIVDDSVTFTSEARNSGEALGLSSNLTVKVMGGAVLTLHGLVKYE